MSKKYVPSFLKQGELPNVVAPASFDSFPMNKPHKDKGNAFDAFPINKRGATTNEQAFDAFTKTKKLPEVDTFSAFNSTRRFGTVGTEEGGATSDAFSAFGSKTRGAGAGAGGEDSHNFPMSKRGDENWAPKGDAARGPRNPHLVFEPMTYGGALTTAPDATVKKTAVVVWGKQPVVNSAGDEKTADVGDSFATKFATKMKIADGPTVVDMESEQDFPTLSVAPTKAQGWAQPLHSEEWTQPVQNASIARAVETKKKQRDAGQGRTHVDGQKMAVSMVPRRRAKRQEEGKEDGEFNPIKYDEDAFDEGEELDSSDLDEDALFADEECGDEEDSLDPNVYENRRLEDHY